MRSQGCRPEHPMCKGHVQDGSCEGLDWSERVIESSRRCWVSSRSVGHAEVICDSCWGMEVQNGHREMKAVIVTTFHSS